MQYTLTQKQRAALVELIDKSGSYSSTMSASKNTLGRLVRLGLADSGHNWNYSERWYGLTVEGRRVAEELRHA